MAWLTANAGTLGIGAAVIAVIAVVLNKDKIAAWWSGTGATVDPVTAFKTLLVSADAAVLQSTPIRNICNLALGGIDKVIETYPNETDKAAAKAHIQALAALLVVAPADAAKV